MLLVIVFVVALIKYTYSNGQLILLAEYRNNRSLVDIKCVAYNISDDSALTWVRTINNASHLYAIKRMVSSKFKPFENFEGTSTLVEWTKSSWKITNSNSHPLHFVIDRRWEDFPINYKSRNYKLQNNLLNIGLSLLSKDDFHIILRFGHQRFRLTRYSLYILYCKSVTWLCVHVRLMCTNKKELFSNLNMWMHIDILWKNGNLLIEGNENVCRANGINFDEQINVTLEVIGELVLWKTHDYKFLWTDIKEDNSEQIGPIISRKLLTYIIMDVALYKFLSTNTKEDNSGQIGSIISNKLKKQYIFLYVALCENCTMDIEIVSGNGKSLNRYHSKAGKQNVKDGKYVWKRLKMEINGSSDISIHTKRQKTDNISNGFWAIDDIRFGNLTEFQLTKTSVHREYLHEWQCHKLNNFKSVQFMDQTSTVNNDNLGQLCSVIYENKKYCEGNKICNFGSNVGQCYCAPGYKGEKCNEECTTGWGLNCLKTCGQCSRGTCHHVNGICESGCKIGYIEPTCEASTPIIRSSPKLVRANATFLILTLKNNSYRGTLEPKYIQFQYKERHDTKWMLKEIKPFTSALDSHLVEGLKLLTEYKIRVILYTENNESYQENDVPFAIYKTTCIGTDKRDISIYTTDTIAQVYINKNSPKSCPDSVYTAVIHQISKSISDITKNIKNLRVYTNYTIVLNNTVLNQTIDINFTTLAGVPGQVKNLKILEMKSNSAIIRWNAPTTKTGSSLIYKVQLSHERHKSCNETKNRPKDLKLDILIVTTTYVAQYLIPYSSYTVRVAAVNEAGVGIFVAETFNTKAADFLTDEEFPVGTRISKISGSTFQLELTLPECYKIKGPILYDIRFNCTNEWCTAVNHTLNYTLTDSITKTNITLIPFSDYNWQLFACRKSCWIVSTNSFQADPSRPRKIRDLQIYTKDENSLSFRCKKPYPPLGKLETYNIACCILFQPCEEFVPRPVIACELWEDSDCFTVGNLKENQFYGCQIYAKNEEVTDVGVKKRIKGYTGQDSPDEPPFFNCTLEENDILVLTWEHPTICNGPIKKFVIKFNAVRSLYTNASFSIEIPVSKLQKTYSFEIKDFRNATEYNIGIYGVNKHIGRSSNKTVISPPPIPNFRETPVLICENNICDIKTELIDNIILNSSLWIVINNIDPNLIIKNNNSIQKKLPELHIKEIFKRLNITETEQYITSYTKVGKSSTEFKLSKGAVLNRKIKINQTVLMSKPPILMHAILASDYLGVVSMKIYQLKYPNDNDIPSFHSSALYWLILVAIIPIAIGIGFMYKKYTTSTKLLQSENDPIIRNSEFIPTTDEIIPLINLPIQDEYIYPCLIQRKNFEQYLVNCSRSQELERQFNLFPKGALKSYHYGNNENNLFKNRMEDIIPYDDTRVILEKLNNDNFSDYINASFIDGYKTPKAYIAAQAPRLATINDFWRMIWQENIKTIVMLTNLTEGDNKKCEQYWPQLENTKEYGAISVENLKEEIFANYVHRILVVSKEKENFEVDHFHFIAWPDHDVPKYYQSLVPFVKEIFNQPLRIVVHCSAGVGRTGTILLCLYNLAMVNDTHTLQFFETVKKFRQQRPDMVNSLKQYKLAHLLVYEILFGVNTELPCDDEFNVAVDRVITRKLIKIQIKHLSSIDWKNQILKSNSSTIIENKVKNKNRFQDIVPGEDSCISLKSYGDGSDYTNAVSVDQLKRKFIVTQQPLPETVGNVWKMVFLNEVTVIVSLNTLDLNDPTSCNFWPDSVNEKMQPIPSVTIKFIGKNRNDIFTTTTCSLKKYINEVVYISKIITIISAHDWHPTKKIPKAMDDLLLILEKLDDFCDTISPIIVTCYDGATASGLFVALSAITERIKSDKICDVCQAVQMVRSNRRQFIRDEDQLKFLYKAALNYFLDNTTYSRIESRTT